LCAGRIWARHAHEQGIYGDAPLPDVTQAQDLPLDSHLHTSLSPDSDVTIDVYAAQAVERRIDEIAITDHVDFDPREPAYRYASFEDREREVRDAAEHWAEHGVQIRFGTEITYAIAFEPDIREHLRHHRYDFVIGSVHVGADSPYHHDRVARWVEGRSMAEIVEPYFSEVAAAARSGLFDTLGHIDFIKRYLHPHVSPAEFAAAPELYEPLLRAMVDSGVGLEINTSGLRQSPGETYPAAPIVALYRQLGGQQVTSGSDAHQAAAFAFGLEDGYRVAAGAGFEELMFRRGGSRITVPLLDRLRT
jgi:histidinol-phosphatase (PHP family)